MKITELTQPTGQALFEALDQDNDTGFATEDLVRIVEQARSGQWSKPMTGDELIALMESWFK